MKTLKGSLFSRKNMDKTRNPYSISKKDMKYDLKDFTVGVVVRMMEEQEKQGNEPDVEVFKEDITVNKDNGGFDWDYSDAGFSFWYKVIGFKDFNLFFEIYPEYEKYNM